LISIDPITPENAFVFKTVRLSALKDAPHAFSATYAKESEFADAEWLQRSEQMNGQRAAGFLAMDGDQACGIVGSFLDFERPYAGAACLHVDGSDAQAPRHRPSAGE